MVYQSTPLPILQSQNAFDATEDHDFTFEYVGDQVFKSRLKVYKNDDGSLVYDETIDSFQLKYTLPANSLTNGIQYNAELSVFNSAGVESSFSKKILFYCFSQPSFSFTNIAQNQVVQNSSVTPYLYYSQSEGETLDSAEISLYSASHTQIGTSGNRYGEDELSYTFNGLTDGTAYYVRATGITTHGMQLDTGFISITVKYIQAGQFYRLQLDNNAEEGSIVISCNVSIITGHSTCPLEFIDNQMIDLSNGCSVRFEEGFLIKDNFDIEIVGYGYNPYETIFSAPVQNGELNIKYMLGQFQANEDHKGYFLLEITNDSGLVYRTSTSPFVTSNIESIRLRIQKINHIYGMYCEVTYT